MKAPAELADDIVMNFDIFTSWDEVCELAERDDASGHWQDLSGTEAQQIARLLMAVKRTP